MSWWSELLLLLLAAGLWLRGICQRDEVFGLFTKFLAVLVVVVVLIAGRPLLLHIAAARRALSTGMPTARSGVAGEGQDGRMTSLRFGIHSTPIGTAVIARFIEGRGE